MTSREFADFFQSFFVFQITTINSEIGGRSSCETKSPFESNFIARSSIVSYARYSRASASKKSSVRAETTRCENRADPTATRARQARRRGARRPKVLKVVASKARFPLASEESGNSRENAKASEEQVRVRRRLPEALRDRCKAEEYRSKALRARRARGTLCETVAYFSASKMPNAGSAFW